MLNRRFALGTIVMSAAMLAGQSLYAAPLASAPLATSRPEKQKMIKFSVRNDSKTPLAVKAGDSMMTLEPGKTTAMKLPVGTVLVAQEATPSYAAGAVITTVSDQLSDATLALK